MEECRAALDNTIRGRKQAEADLDEAHARITDLMAINTNLTSVKAKLEVELLTIQADLSETTKAWKAAEEQAERAFKDAARAMEQLQEEQQHAAKIDGMRRALEEQVMQLQVQIQEAEAASLLSAKRVMSKLECRVCFLLAGFFSFQFFKIEGPSAPSFTCTVGRLVKAAFFGMDF